MQQVTVTEHMMADAAAGSIAPAVQDALRLRVLPSTYNLGKQLTTLYTFRPYHCAKIFVRRIGRDFFIWICYRRRIWRAE